MLIEFSVSNYRSFRERQTLTLTAAPRLRKRENLFTPSVQGETLPGLLKAAVIYGPNASGKSNLLRALSVIPQMARREPSAEKRPLPVSPFKFDRSLLEEPSAFEVHFISRGLRYQFDLALTQERITTERLTAFPKGRETLVYERLFGENGDQYHFGNLEGGAELFATWKKLTSPQVLFISQVVANSSEEINQLRAPFGWLSHSIRLVLDGMNSLSDAAQDLIRDVPKRGKMIASFLQDVDVPVKDIKVEAIKDRLGIRGLGQLSDFEADVGLENKTTLIHHTALGDAELSYDEESEGTKNLIGFFLPWTTRDYKNDDIERCVLCVDELDTSLHPKIVEALVEKHITAVQPTQLVFTTHDTHLMDAKLLRRDQIWITERDENGATQLRSIHDFVGREGEDVEKRYYEGRYRGLPFLKRK